MLFWVFVLLCWMFPPVFFFLVTICKVLNFLAFCLPTQSNLELPANSNLIHYRKFIPYFYVLLEQSFDSLWSGSQAQLRLRNPVVRVKWGWQKQGIWEDSEAAFNSTPCLPASTERLRDQGHWKNRPGVLTPKRKNIMALTRKGLTWLETATLRAFQWHCI